MKILHVITIWLALSAASIAGEKENKAVTDAIPEAIITNYSNGIINGDPYLATVVRKKGENEIRLAIFNLNKAGNYNLIAKSAWWLEHDRWYSKTVKIENNSVYFLLNGMGGCCSDYSIQHQFKPINGEFTLIGTENSEIGIEPMINKDGLAIDRKYISYKSGISINYLTNKTYEYKYVRPTLNGYKDDYLTSKAKKKIVTEKISTFTRTKKVLFENFNIWEEMDVAPK